MTDYDVKRGETWLMRYPGNGHISRVRVVNVYETAVEIEERSPLIGWQIPIIVPAKIRHDFGLYWDYVRQGPFAGFVWFPRIGTRIFRFWVGWKLKAEDRYGVPMTDMRRARCGFALQFKRAG